MVMKNVRLSIYFKGEKKPVAVFDSCTEKEVNEFYVNMNGNIQFIEFYGFIFDKSLFSYATTE